MAEKMAERDPVAAAAQKYRPIQSAVPGTTLGPIQIDAFLGGGVCVSITESLYVKLPYDPSPTDTHTHYPNIFSAVFA